MTNERTFFSSTVNLSGLLVVVTVLTVMASVAGLFGQIGWWVDLFSHFRLQYAALLLVTSGALKILGKPKVCLLGLAGLVLNVLSIYPYYVTATANYSHTPIRAIQLNVNTDEGDASKVAKYILSESPEIVVLEEVDSIWLQQLSVLESTYAHRIKEPRGDNFGIALYSRYPILEQQTLHLGEANVPTISALLKTQHGKLRILGTHTLPPVTPYYARLRDEHLDALAEATRNFINPVLVLGDLNATHWSYAFKTMLRKSRLRDCAQGFGLHPSWPAAFALLRIPIDHCLYSSGIHLQSKAIGPNVGSDHLPLEVTFTISKTP